MTDILRNRSIVLIVFLVLFIILAGFLFASYAGFFTPAFVSAVATSLLVVITAWYALTTRSLLIENRKEQRRSHIRTLIRDGIDEILTTMDKNEGNWSHEQTPFEAPHLPHVYAATFSESVALDLQQEHPELMDRYTEYGVLREEYMEKFRQLRDRFDEEIRAGFRPRNLPPTIEDILTEEFADEETARVVNVNTSTDEFIKEQSYDLAIAILYNSPYSVELGDEALHDYHVRHLLVNQYREEFLQLRDQDEFSDDVAELEELLSEVREEHAALREEFTRIRSEYKDRFDILEVELHPGIHRITAY